MSSRIITEKGICLSILLLFLIGNIGFVNAENHTSTNQVKNVDNSNSEIFEVSNLLNVLTMVVGIAAALIGIWAGQYMQRRTIIKNSMSALREEIEDTRKGLMEDKKTRIDDKFEYIFTLFDDGSFDSIIHSGFFVQFETKIQSDVANLYNRIKRNNQIINYLETLRDKYDLTESETIKSKIQEVQKRNRIKLAKSQIQILKYAEKSLSHLPKNKKTKT